uniref:ras-related and estrogen-regulated growth inhibitor-like protein n=1 Tax=Ciona intestinalis TaxID=7719 RepID=UPI0005214CF7|nr:ras-related and estrogen-regulated growth inhibitor-like protein [Ciona intestinalis]|eukprot:XP_009860415.1 ras-related and estrogen-regulated growth inhibitor-like protein [Ciona intestinalis]
MEIVVSKNKGDRFLRNNVALKQNEQNEKPTKALFKKSGLKLWTELKIKWKNQNKNKPFRILVVGSHNVGKSAILVRFLTRRFIGEYMSGGDGSYNFNTASGRLVTFLDTSSSSTENPVLASNEICRSDGIIVVYDVGDPSSFRYAVDCMHTIRANSNNEGEAEKPILLIGNKTDLEKRRKVSSHKGIEKTCLLVGPNEYEEVSAAEDTGAVSRCMEKLIKKIELKENRQNKKNNETDATKKRFSCQPVRSISLLELSKNRALSLPDIV